MNPKHKKLLAISVFIICLTLFIGGVIAEQSGSTPESGATSRVVDIYDDLFTDGRGSDSAGTWGDWGIHWNRIYSASVWTPSSANAVAEDVASGKKFYAGDNRTELTGNASTTVDFTNQAYSSRDDYAGVGGGGRARRCFIRARRRLIRAR